MTDVEDIITVQSLLFIPTAWIIPGDNPRGPIGDVSELAVSMAAVGQQDPVHVEQLGERRYRLIEGHRRRAAADLAGLPRMWAILRGRIGDCDRLTRQLAMHTHRRPFEPIAEARGIHRLMWEHGLDRDRIARLLGRGPIWVRDRLALLQLDDEQQAAVTRREMSIGTALGIVRQRRDDRDGRTRPATPRPTTARRARARAATAQAHFTNQHPLADRARQMCREGGAEHLARPHVGDVACGQCWEHAIRTDQATRPAQPVEIGQQRAA